MADQSAIEAMWRSVYRRCREIAEEVVRDAIGGTLRGGKVVGGSVGGTLPVSVQQAIDHGNLAGLADDDHPQYTTAAEATTIADTEAAAAVATHVGASDPHTQYQKESEKGAANGYAGLGANSLVPVAQLGTGAPDGSKFLRDDQTFAAPPGGSLAVQEIDGAPDVSNVTRIKVPNGTLTDNTGGVVTFDFGSAATDGAAIHDNTASEISAITEKATPVAADLLLIEDSADGNAKKRVQVGNLPSGGGATIYASAYASPPATPASGDLWLPSDGYHDLFRHDGAAWKPYLRGLPVTLPPTVGGFTWENQGTSTATDTKGVILFTTPADGNFHGMYKATPATPWTLTVAFQVIGYPAAYAFAGLYYRQSADGKIVDWRVVHPGAQGVFYSTKWSTYTTAVAHYISSLALGIYQSQPFWLRISDNGTNRIGYVSTNGRDWLAWHSVGRTDYLTANQFGFCATGHASGATTVAILHWAVT